MKSLFSTLAIVPVMMTTLADCKKKEADAAHEAALLEKRKQALNYLPRITEIVHLSSEESNSINCD